MAIGIEDQYYFDFALGDQTDFINEGNLVTFKVLEFTGNVLPKWEIMFNTSNEFLIARLHEGNDLEVSFGRNPNKTTTTKLVAERRTKTQAGAGLYTIYMSGLYSNLAYMSNPKQFISENKSGVEVIRDIVTGAGFAVGDNDFNIDVSEDSQHWVQHNISARRFVTQVWMHSFLRKSFICVGITTDGSFILKDLRKQFAETPKWNFVVGDVVNDNDIVYDPDPVTDSSAGFINAWMGRGRDRVIHDLEAGTQVNLFIEPEPLLATTQALARRADLEKRHGEVGVFNSNVHPQYWEAHLRNLTNLAVFSSECVVLSFQGLFKNIRILENVTFSEQELVAERTSEHQSGEYIVTGITRELTAGQFGTTVTMCREAPNAIRGDLRATGTSTGTAIEAGV
jgi:hypothetical protein